MPARLTLSVISRQRKISWLVMRWCGRHFYLLKADDGGLGDASSVPARLTPLVVSRGGIILSALNELKVHSPEQTTHLLKADDGGLGDASSVPARLTPPVVSRGGGIDPARTACGASSASSGPSSSSPASSCMHMRR